MGEREELRLRMRDGFDGEHVMEAVTVFERRFGMEHRLKLPLPTRHRLGTLRFVGLLRLWHYP